MRHRRLSALCGALVAGATALTASAPAGGAEGWGPLQGAGGHTLAVALDDQTTALVSVGGPDDATVFDQRRTATGLGPLTPVMTVDGADSCRPVDAATASGDLAVAVECLTTTGLEDPPTTLIELVWTGDDGWVWLVQREGELGSLDYSPQGQYAVFATNSEYGRAHHVTSYHADLGWRDLTRRELRLTGDDLVAAITDSGDVVAVRGAGSEDEPGYWYGGRLRIETYDATTRRWKRRLSRAYPDGGIAPAGVDVAGGRMTATVVESRSTGRLDGREDRVVVLTGKPRHPRSWATPRWSRQVLTASAATTDAGVAVAAWQAVDVRRTAKPWFATWAPGRARPAVHDLRWRTTLTYAADLGLTMDLSVGAGGHGAIAWVGRRPGADRSRVAGAAFDVGPDGRLSGQVDATWEQPVEATVVVSSSATSTAITLGSVEGPFVVSPLTSYSLGP